MECKKYNQDTNVTKIQRQGHKKSYNWRKR